LRLDRTLAHTSRLPVAGSLPHTPTHNTPVPTHTEGETDRDGVRERERERERERGSVQEGLLFEPCSNRWTSFAGMGREWAWENVRPVVHCTSTSIPRSEVFGQPKNGFVNVVSISLAPGGGRHGHPIIRHSNIAIIQPVEVVVVHKLWFRKERYGPVLESVRLPNHNPICLGPLNSLSASAFV
jgi:hypothetical protein